tara:strand:- start:8388 stop:9554 length:1167 start_codon:yes stop_codon:yes gene_type:complete
MKKKIAILGSTGSIGQTTFNIIKKNKQDFEIVFLTTNKNIKVILQQAKALKVKNILVCSKPHFIKVKKECKSKKINIFNNFKDLKKIVKKKIDYTMCSITGLAGLKPTLDCIKLSKTVAIANKESIICGWNLIQKELIKNKTKFIPVDSEHFSIWSLLNSSKNNEVEKIVITASGGPFINLPQKKFKNIKAKSAIKHPRWNMGKKISVDSSTMMNKVFELIEAQRIFNIDIRRFEILTHPKSYLHAIIKFKNGLIKMLLHDTSMSIPIFNSLYFQNPKKIKSNKINLKEINNLNLKKPNIKKFPLLKIIKKIPNKISLFETVVITANDELVNHFLNGDIQYLEIQKYLNKILNLNGFKRYRFKKPRNIKEITSLSEEVRLKTTNLCIR